MPATPAARATRSTVRDWLAANSPIQNARRRRKRARETCDSAPVEQRRRCRWALRLRRSLPRGASAYPVDAHAEEQCYVSSLERAGGSAAGYGSPPPDHAVSYTLAAWRSTSASSRSATRDRPTSRSTTAIGPTVSVRSCGRCTARRSTWCRSTSATTSSSTKTGAYRRIGFEYSPDDVRPRWPDPAHPQQVHLDIEVSDAMNAPSRGRVASGRRCTPLTPSGCGETIRGSRGGGSD